MPLDDKMLEVLDKTQPQSVLDHLISEARSLQQGARRMEDALERIRSEQGHQHYIDQLIQKASKQDSEDSSL